MSKKPFVVEGYLNLVNQEGGYSGPDWEVDGTAIAKALAEHFGCQGVMWDTPSWRKMPHHTVPGDIPIGKVRITIERLSE